MRRTLWLTALMAFSWPMIRLCSSAFHVEELGGLFLGELVDRDAGPDAEHLGDGFLVDLVEQVDAAGLDLGLLGGLLLEQRLLLVAQATGLLEALLLDGALLGLLHLGELVLDLACRSGGVPMRLMRRRLPASSIRSIALSGRWRSLM